MRPRPFLLHEGFCLMWTTISSQLGSPERRAFLQTQLLRAIKTFGLCLICFAWLLDASAFGASLWAAFFALFIGVGGAYLSWDDATPDQEILQHLNRVNGIAVGAGEPE